MDTNPGADANDELAPILPGIRARAGAVDRSADWPAEDLAELERIGALRWSAPHALGGLNVANDDRPGSADALALHERYCRVASASLAVALILSQRDSAVGLIETAPASPMAAQLLSELADNRVFATVGIAQLTTSRQTGPPALSAERVRGGWRLDGVIPWATGAGKSDYIVAGAVLADRRQTLFALPTAAAGIAVEAPLPLVAMRGTWTGAVRCDRVLLEDRWLLRGPADKVLAERRTALPLGQAFLALGLCESALDLIRAHRSEAATSAATRFDAQQSSILTEVRDLSRPDRAADALSASPRLRGACNDLAVRLTHAAIALYKGSALLLDHPAQRLAREAMFLLVWSCPGPVIECTVERLAEVGAR